MMWENDVYAMGTRYKLFNKSCILFVVLSLVCLPGTDSTKKIPQRHTNVTNPFMLNPYAAGG